jgi:hypothetical protein
MFRERVIMIRAVPLAPGWPTIRCGDSWQALLSASRKRANRRVGPRGSHGRLNGLKSINPNRQPPGCRACPLARTGHQTKKGADWRQPIHSLPAARGQHQTARGYQRGRCSAPPSPHAPSQRPPRCASASRQTGRIRSDQLTAQTRSDCQDETPSLSPLLRLDRRDVQRLTETA